MAGTLFGLGLSQQFDVNGDPMAGCLLHIYLANTSTPVIAYSTSSLTAGQELPWPIVGDSTGRIPAFWVDDGSYRARLTDADGNPQFDEANMLALGPSTGTGGGGDTTDANSVASTGDVKWRPVNGVDISGWVIMNSDTVGSATSGADYAAAANQNLFLYIWNNFSNTLCPVITGRGATAQDDWDANKRITTLDMRGRSPFGTDSMGATASDQLLGVSFDAGDKNTGGSKGGDGLYALLTEQLPSHTHANAVATSDGAHTHDVKHTIVATYQSGGGIGAVQTITSGGTSPGTAAAISNGAHTHPVSMDSTGGGGAHPNMPPFMLGTWYWRL